MEKMGKQDDIQLYIRFDLLVLNKGPGGSMSYLTTHTSLSPIRCGFAPGVINYKKGCIRLATTSDIVYQLLAHGRWLSPASSTTNTGHHAIADTLLKVALSTKNQSKSINQTTIYSSKLKTAVC